MTDRRPGAKRALDYLATHHVMTLATAGESGPWAAAVFYAHHGFDLYFVSSPRARHSIDVASRPAAAATVQEDYSDWRLIRGLQLAGEVHALAGDEAAFARGLYAQKFVVARGDSDGAEAVNAALAKAVWYRFRAVRAFLIDNAVGFGKREQVL